MARSLDVTLYTPHPAQVPVHASAARFRIATCGRRFGKTMLAVNESAKRSLGFGRGDETAWIAPTYKQSRIAYDWTCREFRGAFAGPPSLSELRIPWASGCAMEFRSADNYDAIRGKGYRFVVGDEFGFWPRAAWEEAVRPTLSDRNGHALLVGTPKGRNLFHELWSRGQDRAAWPDYESWQLPTSANPFIPASEIEEARRSLPSDVFRQEYEAQFLDDSAGVFRGLARCEKGALSGPEPYATYVIGWDPAKQQDASVMTVMDLATKHVVAFDRFLHVEYTLQLARLAALVRQYHNATVLMDWTGVGDPLLEQVQHLGIQVEGYHFTNASKQQLVEHLAVQIEQEAISWPAELTVLHHELALFQYEVTRAGNVRYSAPEGHMDDCVMSLALAAWAAKHGVGFVLGTAQAAKPPVRLVRGRMP